MWHNNDMCSNLQRFHCVCETVWCTFKIIRKHYWNDVRYGQYTSLWVWALTAWENWEGGNEILGSVTGFTLHDYKRNEAITEELSLWNLNVIILCTMYIGGHDYVHSKVIVWIYSKDWIAQYPWGWRKSESGLYHVAANNVNWLLLPCFRDQNFKLQAGKRLKDCTCKFKLSFSEVQRF